MSHGVSSSSTAEAGLDRRHPVQLYEAAFNTCPIVLARRTDTDPDQYAPGVRAAVLMGVYCLGRFFIEFFKEYQVMSSSSFLTMGQIMSIFGLILCGTTAYILSRREDMEIDRKWPSIDGVHPTSNGLVPEATASNDKGTEMC